jgi:hypothetical protein
MIHIIKTQANKRIESFVYEYNTENTDISISKEKKENNVEGVP